MRLLLVEDDPQLVSSLTKGLEELGASVIHAAGTEEAWRCIETELLDLVLLDLGLPRGDGLDLLRSIRADHAVLPVVILSARSGLEDRVHGLQLGADDYLPKPFAFTELTARIDAVLRRSVRDDLETAAGDVRVNRLERTVTLGDVSLELTRREVDILAYLMAHRHRTVSRDELVRGVWKVRSRATPMDNVIDVSLSRLRGKLADAFDRPFVETVRGMGYRYRP